MGSSNMNIPQEEKAPSWAEQYAKDLQSGVQGQVQEQINQMLGTGQINTRGESGLLQSGGGVNQYGFARPGYTLLQDQSGQLDPRFVEQMGESYSALQQKGLAEGDTKSAELARQRQGLMSAQAMDAAARQQAGANARAQDQLAMRGGLRGGAAERLASQGAQGLMRARQMQAQQDQLANLGISMQDEAMKNQLLGQTGQVEQTLGGRNIERLAKDIERENMQRFGVYAEDMQARGAQHTAAAQQAASCFTGDTYVVLEDGREVKIRDIQLGDVCDQGGKIYAISKALVDHYYNYCGVNVTGGHSVLEDGKFIRVRDSKLAVPVYKSAVVYSPANENHRLHIKGMIFGDLHEDDMYDHLTEDELLEKMNESLNESN